MREFDLLRHIYRSNDRLDVAVRIPPGDDMGMIRFGGGDVLAAVDQLVGGRHVNLETTSLQLVGRKAIARSLSDIAAMAARPLCTLVAATLPPDFGEDRAQQLFESMRRTCERFACPLIGGDLAFHGDPAHPLVCSVTVLAEPGPVAPVLRSGAKPGDTLYVTGQLGGTMLDDGSGHHLTFDPRITEALMLAGELGERLHAMIDLSDGLGRDADHIAEASGVKIVIDAARLPRRGNATWEDALQNGEDYELCFAAAGSVPSEVRGVPITPVGEVLPGDADESPARLCVRDGDTLREAGDFGWQHEA